MHIGCKVVRRFVTKDVISTREEVVGRKKMPVFGSKPVPRRIFEIRSSISGASTTVFSLKRTTANFVLYPVFWSEVLIPLIAVLSSLSWRVLRFGSDGKSKKATNTQGTCSWCFAIQSGVNIPSGYSEDSGESGESFECRTHCAGDFGFSSPAAESTSRYSGPGAPALRVGKTYL